MHKPRYSFSLEGSSHLLRAAAEVQEEVIEPFFDTDDWQYDREYFEKVPTLYRRKQPMAFAGAEVAIAVGCFLGTCFGKKIFDEFYERTLKRPIGAQLDKLFQKADVPSGKVVEYRDVVYFEDIDLVVVIRAIATKENTETLQSQVMQAHLVAYSYIEKHGRQAPIHCHKIADGQISIHPELFASLEAIKQQDVLHTRVIGRR